MESGLGHAMWMCCLPRHITTPAALHFFRSFVLSPHCTRVCGRMSRLITTHPPTLNLARHGPCLAWTEHPTSYCTYIQEGQIFRKDRANHAIILGRGGATAAFMDNRERGRAAIGGPPRPRPHRAARPPSLLACLLPHACMHA